MEKTKNRPWRQYVSYGAGGIVGAALWSATRRFRNGSVGTFPTISISRRYRDPKTGEWKNVSSFSLADLKRLKDVIGQVIMDLDGFMRPAESEERRGAFPDECPLSDEPPERIVAPARGNASHGGIRVVA
jgi:hypothetical protein